MAWQLNRGSEGTMIEEIHPKGKDFTLKEMQERVGGYVERVSSAEGRTFASQTVNTMWVNEEGLLKQLAVNPIATDIAGQVIHGTAVLIMDKDAYKEWMVPYAEEEEEE